MELSIWNLVYRSSRWCHIKFKFHSNLDTLTYFTAKDRSKSFFCIYGLKNCIEASDHSITQPPVFCPGNKLPVIAHPKIIPILSFSFIIFFRSGILHTLKFYLHSLSYHFWLNLCLRFGTHTYIVSVLTPTDFRHGWANFGPLGDKNVGYVPVSVVKCAYMLLGYVS